MTTRQKLLFNPDRSRRTKRLFADQVRLLRSHAVSGEAFPGTGTVLGPSGIGKTISRAFFLPEEQKKEEP